MKVRWWLIAVFVVGFTLPVAAGFYSKSVSKKDGTKVSLRFPPKADSDPKPAVLDIAKFGGLKKTAQPWRARIYARVRNASAEPKRVRVSLENCEVPADWHVRDYTWDEETQAIREPLPPGKRFGIYIFFNITGENRKKAVICDGFIRAVDADTGETLAGGRVVLLNSAVGPANITVPHSSGDATHDGARHN